MPVFSVPLSGLSANSTALSAIANNLANLNTVGYKQTRAVFRDLFYQSLGTSGSGNPIQVGAGAAIGSLSTVFTGGSVESSGVPTDVAIVGDGFFALQKDGVNEFTRAGNFHIGPGGLLMSEDGAFVMGYPAQDGRIQSGQVGPLQVGGSQISAPQATQSVELFTNLNVDAGAGSSFSTPMTVYDSLGAKHVLTFTFTKSGANAWDFQVSVPTSELNIAPPADGSKLPDSTIVIAGTLTFSDSGNLVQQTYRSPSDTTDQVAFHLETDGTPVIDGPCLVNIAGLKNGAADMSINWQVADAAKIANGERNPGFLTQVAAPSDTSATQQDGFGAGTLLNFAIGSDGIIQGAFTNGKTMVLGQLALANFANSQGLVRAGANNFSESLASGAPVYGQPGSGGRGTLQGGALELSNVDIAKEFAQMITAQRGFQASARAITTFDEIAQETINLKR